MLYLNTATKGIGLTLGLLSAVGTQNAFVIKQCLSKRYVLLTALTCTLLDALLITGGINGLGHSINSNPKLLHTLTWIGIIFLSSYGLWCAKTAFSSSQALLQYQQLQNTQNWKKTLLSLLAVSFLNPHVLLETLLIIGGIGAQYVGTERLVFNLSTVSAAGIWFFALSFGCKKFSFWLSRPIVLRVLHGIIACIMIGISISLFKHL